VIELDLDTVQLLALLHIVLDDRPNVIVDGIFCREGGW